MNRIQKTGVSLICLSLMVGAAFNFGCERAATPGVAVAGLPEPLDVAHKEIWIGNGDRLHIVVYEGHTYLIFRGGSGGVDMEHSESCPKEAQQQQ